MMQVVEELQTISKHLTQNQTLCSSTIKIINSKPPLEQFNKTWQVQLKYQTIYLRTTGMCSVPDPSLFRSSIEKNC